MPLVHPDPPSPNSAWTAASSPLLPEQRGNADFAAIARPIDKPPSDGREYRLIRLLNGLEALLVRDGAATEAAAAMTVGVGSLMDPIDLPGAAHLCEHLLFMGTKKYPRENIFRELIACHGGDTNAFTALGHTTYHFNIAASSLLPALDMFAHFFISPLFLESTLEREVQAVHSEHTKNLRHDYWRMFQLEKSQSREGHPYGGFGTGDVHTLLDDVRRRGGDTRAEVLAWWEANYSAERMRLVVCGNEPLDVLTRNVVEIFNAVPARSLPHLAPFSDDVFGSKIRGTKTFVETVVDSRILSLNWEIGDEEERFMTKPATFISHLIGHEGPGSILSYLRRQGLALRLSAGPSKGAAGFGFFRITCHLTLQGLGELLVRLAMQVMLILLPSPGQHEVVAHAIFAYVALLQASNSASLNRLYEELSHLGTIKYRFSESVPSLDKFVSDLSVWLTTSKAPQEWLLSQPHLLRQFDERVIRETLSEFTVEGCRMVIGCQQVPDGAGGGWNQVEPIYQTRYRTEKLSSAFIELARMSLSFSSLRLPERNVYIPTDFDIKPSKAASAPVLSIDERGFAVWHARALRFPLPRASFRVLLSSPAFYDSPLAAVSTELLASLYRDEVEEKIYNATLAGLRFSVTVDHRHVVLSVEGFSDKLLALATAVVNGFFGQSEFDPERLNVMRSELRQRLDNSLLQEPWHTAQTCLSNLLCPDSWYPEDMIRELENITPEVLHAFRDAATASLSLTAFAYGNLDAEEVHEAARFIQARLGPRKQLGETGPVAIVLPRASCNSLGITNTSFLDPSSAVLVYIQLATLTSKQPISPALRAMTTILAHFISEPCFDVLRTRESLGYLVESGFHMTPTTIGLQIRLQSTYSAVHLRKRIEVFLEEHARALEDLDEAAFVLQRDKLAMVMAKSTRSLKEEGDRLWQRILDGDCDFEQRTADLTALKQIDKAELLAFYRRLVDPRSPERRQVAILVQSWMPKSFVVGSFHTLWVLARQGVRWALGRLTGRSGGPVLETIIPNARRWKAGLDRTMPVERVVM